MLPNSQEACDLPDMGISTFEISKILKEPALNPFSKLDLEFLGLSCVPELLSKATLKILHIRQSAYDLRRYASWALKPSEHSSAGYPNSEFVFRDKFRDFLKWVFGPDGIRSLHMIVFGDFAYGGRIAQKNVLLCRDFGGNKGFRIIDAVDAEWIEVRDEYRSTIEACPTEPILGETCGMA
ncbi:Endonuclease/exonuclease/phosphatase [Purpureocillium lavendulum]|uniref:Endonuclease/exonuclease/phosphatase n=1 Tax=Purpureocillium lavendulum TaxID=1247861 RepID=A0AB34FCV0_9HYPO|nr:Endonuclease/exonuclease/phosphatase [Purpureocillium lavendulum]